jgi:hypothetical protein
MDAFLGWEVEDIDLGRLEMRNELRGRGRTHGFGAHGVGYRYQ